MDKRVIALLPFIIFCTVLKAQFDAQFSQYWASKSYYNPASVGATSGVNAVIMNRQQWVGIKGAPKSLYASADMPFVKWGKDQGIGVGLYKDNLGLFSNVSLTLNYAYKLQLWGGTLALGSQLGLVSKAFDGEKVELLGGLDDYHEGTDPSIPSTNVSGTAFDMGLGIQYSNEKYYTGLSVTHLLEPTVEFEKGSSNIGRAMYLMAGMNIPVEASSVVLYPSTLLKTDFSIVQAELTLRAEYNKRFWGGLSYRLKDAIVLMAGVRLKNISIGYAYDISNSKLSSVSGGSHELFASYSFEMQLASKSKRKYNKSLRFL